MRQPSWWRLATTDGVISQALVVGAASLLVSIAAGIHYLPRARATGQGALVFLILITVATCIAFSLLLLGIAAYRAIEIRRMLRTGTEIPATVTRRTWFFGTVLHYRLDLRGREVERWSHLASRRRGRHLAPGDAVTVMVDPRTSQRTLLLDIYR